MTAPRLWYETGEAIVDEGGEIGRHLQAANSCSDSWFDCVWGWPNAGILIDGGAGLQCTPENYAKFLGAYAHGSFLPQTVTDNMETARTVGQT